MGSESCQHQPHNANRIATNDSKALFSVEEDSAVAGSIPLSPTDAAEKKMLAAAFALESGLRELPAGVDAQYYAALKSVLDFCLPMLYAAYDAYVAALLSAESRKVSCGRGCTACCRHFVDSVEPFEMAGIHLHIRDWKAYPELVMAFHRRTMLIQTLRGEEVAKTDPETAEDRALYRYYIRGVPCPFLQADGACGIYAVRPMSCRMFFSESSPKFCAGTAIASPWNKNFQVELPEAVERALGRAAAPLQALEFSEGLFPGLLQANERFGRWDGSDAPITSVPSLLSDTHADETKTV